MPPAIIAGGVAAVGAIGGAVISSSAQKKAASQASAAQQDSTQAQLQLGRESMALNKDIYNKNAALLNPFVQRGNTAGNAINSMLGLGAATTAPPVATAPATGTTVPATTAPRTGAAARLAEQRGSDFGTAVAGLFRIGQHQRVPTPVPTQQTTAPVTTTTAPAPTTQQQQMDAFNTFANSGGMQFQQQQAANSINHLYAGHGALQSGAAMKAISDRSQDIALNNYFLPYMNMLGNQQAVGAQSGAAVAGVGSNFGNTAAGINANMGGAIQSGANALSNAAIARGNANAGMWSTIGSSLGGIASSFIK